MDVTIIAVPVALVVLVAAVVTVVIVGVIVFMRLAFYVAYTTSVASLYSGVLIMLGVRVLYTVY